MCVIDWGLTADVLGALAGLIAAGVALWAAARAYPDWLRRQNHLRKSERAEEVLTSFYVFKRALAAARDWTLRESDLTAADKKLKNSGVATKDISDPLVVGQAYLDRLHFYSDDFMELHKQIPFAEVNFGSEVSKALGEMLSIHSLLSTQAKFLPKADKTAAVDVRKKLFNSDQADLSDWINKQIKAVEDELKMRLTPFVEVGETTTQKRFNWRK